MYKWLILMSLLYTVAEGQIAYTWVDEDGTTHYSDRPFPGSTVIELDSAQGFAAPAPTTRGQREEVEETDPADAYTAFNIIEPSHQETLWNIGGNLNVTLELTPGLSTGHRVGVILDGELTDVISTVSQFQLTDVVRGQHTLQAVVLDASGGEVLRSLAITVMVQQTSLQNPNNPNAG